MAAMAAAADVRVVALPDGRRVAGVLAPGERPAVFGCFRTVSVQVAPSRTKFSRIARSVQPSLDDALIRLQPTVRVSIGASTQWPVGAVSRNRSSAFAWPVAFQGLAKSASQPACPAWQAAHSPTNGSGGLPVRFPTPTYFPHVRLRTLLGGVAFTRSWIS
jgi:hypothetical protein